MAVSVPWNWDGIGRRRDRHRQEPRRCPRGCAQNRVSDAPYGHDLRAGAVARTILRRPSGDGRPGSRLRSPRSRHIALEKPRHLAIKITPRPLQTPLLGGGAAGQRSPFPAPYAAILETYAAALQTAPLSDQTRRTYTSKVRQFLAWLADADLDANPLASADGRDRAVRD